MIVGKTFDVGEDAVDLTDGTGSSGVTLLRIKNLGTTLVYLAGEYPIPPGGVEAGIDVGGADQLLLYREKQKPAEPVAILIRYSA